MELALRSATEHDLTFARDLTRRAMLPYYGRYSLLWQEEAFNQAWLWRDNFIVLADGVACGYFSLSIDRQALFIRELHLLPEARNQGIGGWALERIVELARERRLPRVRLMVFQSNPARHLYLRKGFAEVGEDECFWRMERMTDV
jgi:GNAT superfamily N-acetyltransferase